MMQYTSPFKPMPHLGALRGQALALALLAWQAQGWAAGPALQHARVERLVVGPEAVTSLPAQVLCRSQAVQSVKVAQWLLVSRSWGGSPQLRQYQLLNWDGAQHPQAQHVPVRWGNCESRTENTPKLSAR
jgi:hypothetical protein